MFLSLAFLSSTSLLMFFLSFRTIRLENTKFVCGENLFTDSITFLILFNTFFPFVKSLVPACTIRVSGLFLTSSSTSSEMISVVPAGKFFILTWMSFDSPFHLCFSTRVSSYYHPWFFSWFLVFICSFLHCVISIILHGNTFKNISTSATISTVLGFTTFWCN